MTLRNNLPSVGAGNGQSSFDIKYRNINLQNKLDFQNSNNDGFLIQVTYEPT